MHKPFACGQFVQFACLEGLGLRSHSAPLTRERYNVAEADVEKAVWAKTRLRCHYCKDRCLGPKREYDVIYAKFVGNYPRQSKGKQSKARQDKGKHSKAKQRQSKAKATESRGKQSKAKAKQSKGIGKQGKAKQRQRQSKAKQSKSKQRKTEQ